jgi:hypothetical protein
MWSTGQSSRLQIQWSGFDSVRYQIFLEVVSLERCPLSLVSTIEELLARKSSGFGLENDNTAVGDPPRWLRDIPLSVQHLQQWIVCKTCKSVNVFETLATQENLQYHCKTLFETPYITITILNIIHCPDFYLKHNVSKTGFCLRLLVVYTQLGPIDRAIPWHRSQRPALCWTQLSRFHERTETEYSLRNVVFQKHKTMDNVHNCEIALPCWAHSGDVMWFLWSIVVFNTLLVFLTLCHFLTLKL